MPWLSRRDDYALGQLPVSIDSFLLASLFLEL